MGTVLEFLSGNWVRLVVYAALIASLLTVVWFHGLFTGREALIEYKGEQATKRAEIVVKVQKVLQTVRVPYVKREYEIREHFYITEKENANVPNRPECNVTAGWMRGHNNAAAGSGREPGALDDKADTGIGEAAALGTITRNYRSYHQVANDLKSCREFVRELPKVLE